MLCATFLKIATNPDAENKDKGHGSLILFFLLIYGTVWKTLEKHGNAKIGQSTTKKLNFSPLSQIASLGSAVLFSEDI